MHELKVGTADFNRHALPEHLNVNQDACFCPDAAHDAGDTREGPLDDLNGFAAFQFGENLQIGFCTQGASDKDEFAQELPWIGRGDGTQNMVGSEQGTSLLSVEIHEKVSGEQRLLRGDLSPLVDFGFGP